MRSSIAAPMKTRPPAVTIGPLVEDDDVAHFRGLRDGVPQLTLVPHPDKIRRARNVVVPNVVMDHLVMPDAFAGVGAEREDAIAEEILADAIAAPVIIARRTRAGHSREGSVPAGAVVAANNAVASNTPGDNIVQRRPFTNCSLPADAGAKPSATHTS
jgi:hypothetical protein